MFHYTFKASVFPGLSSTYPLVLVMDIITRACTLCFIIFSKLILFLDFHQLILVVMEAA